MKFQSLPMDEDDYQIFPNGVNDLSLNDLEVSTAKVSIQTSSDLQDIIHTMSPKQVNIEIPEKIVLIEKEQPQPLIPINKNPKLMKHVVKKEEVLTWRD